MASIQGIYIALFGRPADPVGLDYFNGVTKGGADLSGIGNLAGQKEYIDRFTALSTHQIINSIYQSLFGRDAEAAGVSFWAEKMATGALTINNIAIAILDGAAGTDKATVTNKITVASFFTQNLDTPAEIAAYNGTAATVAIAKYLSGIGASSTIDTAAVQHIIDELTGNTGGGTSVGDNSGGGTSGGTPPVAGFTTGTDTLSTTDGSHVYKATLGAGATLTENDSLHGNGNTLEISNSLGSFSKMPDGVNLSGISALTLTTAGNAGDIFNVFDLSRVGGLTSFALNASGEGIDNLVSTSSIDLTLVTASQFIGIDGGFSTLDIRDSHLTTLNLGGQGNAITLRDLPVGQALTINASALLINHSDITDADNRLQSLTIAETGTSSGSHIMGAINSSSLTSLTVSGDIYLGGGGGITLNVGGSVTEVDLSGNTHTAHANYVRVDSDASVVLGTNTNFVDVVQHAGASFTVGPNAALGSSTGTAPNLVIIGHTDSADAGTVVRFAATPGGLIDTLSLTPPAGSSAMTEGEFLDNMLERIRGLAVGRTAYYSTLNGNTYIINTADGLVDSDHVAIVKTFGILSHIHISDGSLML